MEQSVKNRKNSTKSSDFGLKDPRLLNIVNVPTFPYKSSSEYAAAVNQWLWQCYNWQCISITLPYVMTQTACRTQISSSTNTVDFNRNFTNSFFPNQNLFVAQPRRPDASTRAATATGESQGIFSICFYYIPF